MAAAWWFIGMVGVVRQYLLMSEGREPAWGVVLFGVVVTLLTLLIVWYLTWFGKRFVDRGNQRNLASLRSSAQSQPPVPAPPVDDK